MFSKTPSSNANTYQDIGAFWDEHDTTEFGEQTEVEFDVKIQSQHKLYLSFAPLKPEYTL